MFPILFTILGYPVQSYGFFVALGYLCGLFYLVHLARVRNQPVDFFLDLAFVGVVSGIIGARILFILTNLDHYTRFPIEAFYVWNGGLVFYGGFLLAIPFCVLFTRWKKRGYEETYDMIVAPLTLGHAIGRIGCLGAGCCHGSVTSVPWALRFNSELVDKSIRGLPLHPTQIYEAVILGAFSICAGLYLKSRDYKVGKLYPAYMFVYGVGRFIVEIYRGDSVRGFVGHTGLSTSQGVALLVVLGSLPFVYKNYFYKRSLA